MNTTTISTNKIALYKKLYNLQKEIGAVAKDKTNPHFKSSYTDINGIIDHLRPLLTQNNLLLLQPIVDGIQYSIITDIDTCESIESKIAIPAESNPQKLGSAITYYRRYTLQSLLALQAEDDDGNAAAGQQPATTIQQPVERKIMTEPAYFWLKPEKMADVLKNADIERIKTAINHKYPKPLAPVQMEKLKHRETELIEIGVQEMADRAEMESQVNNQ